MEAICVAGMGFGDEGKGATVDALCREYNVDTIVRYNGGGQAAHNVVTPEGIHHTFAQFGAGMLASRTVKTFLSRFMLVDPITMIREAEALQKLTPNVWDRVTVDRRAVVVTPLHKQLNRLREQARGVARHGSCGMGIGVARELQLKYGDQVLLAGDLSDTNLTNKKLNFLVSVLHAEIVNLQELLEVPKFGFDSVLQFMRESFVYWPARVVDHFEPAPLMVFEGAQGILLDEKHGTAPHNTWTNTTFGNADTLLDEVGVSFRQRVGCIRTYHTRHGQGPFAAHDPMLNLPEPHNGNDGHQGAFRVGRFDWNLLHAALFIAKGIDYFAVSHLDYLPRLGMTKSEFLGRLEELFPVGMTATGPTASHRIMHHQAVA